MQSVILSARSFLESRLNQTRNDTYAMALLTYAFQVSGSLLADEALTALNTHAIEEGTLQK